MKLQRKNYSGNDFKLLFFSSIILSEIKTVVLYGCHYLKNLDFCATLIEEHNEICYWTS